MHFMLVYFTSEIYHELGQKTIYRKTSNMYFLWVIALYCAYPFNFISLTTKLPFQVSIYHCLQYNCTHSVSRIVSCSHNIGIVAPRVLETDVRVIEKESSLGSGAVKITRLPNGGFILARRSLRPKTLVFIGTCG